jgi:hypothetical protein
MKVKAASVGGLFHFRSSTLVAGIGFSARPRLFLKFTFVLSDGTISRFPRDVIGPGQIASESSKCAASRSISSLRE